MTVFYAYQIAELTNEEMSERGRWQVGRKQRRGRWQVGRKLRKVVFFSTFLLTYRLQLLGVLRALVSEPAGSYSGVTSGRINY